MFRFRDLSALAKYSDLAGKTVLITGGANGIGEAMVRAFVLQKAKVFFCDVDAKAGRNLAGELGGSVVFRKVDLVRESSIRSWVQSVGRLSRRIDVVVNNAARDPRISFDAMTAAQWDDLFAINLRAYFLVAREALPRMGDGGSIVNFASLTFHDGPVRMSAYVATKGGVIGLTRSLARELGPRGIRVNTLSPGWIMTPRQLKEHVDEATKQFILKVQSVPKLIQPGELAEVALFLASDSSRVITGQEILADRGWHHS